MQRKTIRRAQAIMPFGIGAIVDFPGQSLMAAGLDVWPDKPECPIHDDRLAHRLEVRYFRAPPPGPREGQIGEYLPFVRFPLWHFCPRCRSMFKTSWNEPFPPRCASPLGLRFKSRGVQNAPCSALPEKKRWRMIPVRFIVACENGHIDDFPWIEWAHSSPGHPLDEAKICDSPQLRLDYTGKAGLMGLIVKCEHCQIKPRSLMGAAGPNSLKGWPCKGNRPWLGPNGQEICNPASQPRMLQRGSTNIYFPKVISSILIPPYSEKINMIVESYWWMLTPDAKGVVDEGRIQDVAKRCQINADSLKEAVLQKFSGYGNEPTIGSEEDYRYSEYLALMEAVTNFDDEFVTSHQDLKLYDKKISQYIDKICLVEKLAETRALTGFSRIKPPQYREYVREDRTQLSLQTIPWLPAIRVYGEGIFIKLNETLVDKWVNKEIKQRYEGIINNYVRIYKNLKRTPRRLPMKFFLLHTLAHALIRRLSFECGYGSSSLRERLYCWDEKHKKMTGILIYTAAGDSEGTMGGLVQQGKPGRFETLLVGAIQDILWCSSDPICIESHGQGIDSLNRAACYACALLPETSCEEGNRFLDRVALIGTPDEPSLGFFTEIVQEIMSGLL